MSKKAPSDPRPQPRILSEKSAGNFSVNQAAVTFDSPHNSADSARRLFTTLAWSLLIYHLAVIAWGAFVRASFSGDGCGSHWPLCDGEIIPSFSSHKLIIELSHRATSGMILPMLLALLIYARRLFPSGHQSRKALTLALVLAGVEALIGAALVKLHLVADNDTIARASVMSFHLVTTFFLVGSITVAALQGSAPARFEGRGQGAVGWALALGYISIIVLGVSGAVSALGHTLRPTDNVLAAAISSNTHWMVRLQPLHPLIATSVGLYLLLTGGLLIHLRPTEEVRKAVRAMVGLYALQLIIGLVNILIKAPIWLQMIHLATADAVWISFVCVGVFATRQGIPRVEQPPREKLSEEAPLQGWALVKGYVGLTKPRVISLLLFTTLAALIIAKGGWPGGWLFFAVALGGYMAAGAANAINMVIDRDIDAQMKRTAKRPTVTQSISSGNALLFGFSLAAGSFALLWGVANLLAAMLAFAGLVFYIIVYTILLKRRTWHNIVIGGAAGAFPPLVGFAAVTNTLSPLAWFLFAIIFVWTPVHFWALALLIQDDYRNAGVPMLPVVHGERVTVIQIALYAVLTTVISILPFVQRDLGTFYVAGAILLNSVLLLRCGQLYRQPNRPRAVSLYKYSMLYLALLFVIIAVDRVGA